MRITFTLRKALIKEEENSHFVVILHTSPEIRDELRLESTSGNVHVCHGHSVITMMMMMIIIIQLYLTLWHVLCNDSWPSCGQHP